MADAHGTPAKSKRRSPLSQRLVSVRKQVDKTYRLLQSPSQRIGRIPSPAEEWLVDNSHIVFDQIREIREDLPPGYLVELPRLASGKMGGYPRVYGVCLDYLRHTEARVELESFTSYINAYQSAHSLTIGELWAAPIMLRLGLVIAVGSLVTTEADTGNVRTNASDIAQDNYHQQARDQIWIGNAITSMRQVNSLEWTAFFEQASRVESLLIRDPALAYGRMDEASRDCCRHAVERLSRSSAVSEPEVAQIALDCATGASASPASELAESHVGYYLVGPGQDAFKRRIGYKARLSERVRAIALRNPTVAYVASVSILTLTGLALALRFVPSYLHLGLLSALLVLPASEIAVGVTNFLVGLLLPPQVLPKLAFKTGVPPEFRTLVVVPALLDSAATLHRLVADLEVRSLANTDAELRFALLTDFPDANTASAPEDAELLRLAIDAIAELNRRHSEPPQSRYLLLHRRRTYNESEGRYMGWERKRGKLYELNRLLQGATDTGFDVISPSLDDVRGVRFVITLDADTELPRGVARRLIGTLAHPLNQPVFDALKQRVVRGFGIIQPRVGTLPESARRSAFARVFAGRVGVDPYTMAVSDVYQDLFGEGSFIGKGIYDVSALSRSMLDRVPVNTMLSHDLFEGIFARSALASDIELLDDHPSSYAVVVGREHRWVRGDWQLLPWLWPRVPGVSKTRRNDLRPRDLWKVFDNIRRSLTPPALIAVLVVAWLSSRDMAAKTLIAVGLVLVAPILSRRLFAAARAKPGQRSAAFGEALPADIGRAVLSVVFLLDHTLVLLDAIGRTLWRMYWSHEHLLEWVTTSQSSRREPSRKLFSGYRLWFGAALSLSLLVTMTLAVSTTLAFATPILASWIVAPVIALLLSRNYPATPLSRSISPLARQSLRRIARKTWRFFETFVTSLDNYLPPDNFQEVPRGVIAHRTSPTNIGLYLLSVVAARDFGFITLATMLRRVEETLTTIERLERYQGHLLNWYDTVTLQPLEPRYVSSVDSGNLLGYLWTLSQACAEAKRHPIYGTEIHKALCDALRLANESFVTSADKGESVAIQTSNLLQRVSAAEEHSFDVASALGLIDLVIAELAILLPLATQPETQYWLRAADDTARGWRSEISQHFPFVEWMSKHRKTFETSGTAAAFAALCSALERAFPDMMAQNVALVASAVNDFAQALAQHPLFERQVGERCIAELDEELSRARESNVALAEKLNELSARSSALADGMNFTFLMGDSRRLLSIGYNVTSARLDPSQYDLLASEARLASIVAIAKGDIPGEHWMRLGRARTTAAGGRALLSWSGSMFEYLMPLLVTYSSEDTLLSETYKSAVRTQIAYARSLGTPWGISEAAYNVMDLSLTYQYKAFGVPGLGLKAGLAEHHVVSPYATVLACMVAPAAGVSNLEHLTREGLDATYGLYESIDYTPANVPPGRRGIVVKAFMAHHQGMSLVALDNLLNDDPMPRRFHADPRVQATELTLEERIPFASPTVELRAAAKRAPLALDADVDSTEPVAAVSGGPVRCQLIGNGEFSTLITQSGSGLTTHKGSDINRFRFDSTLEGGGIYAFATEFDSGDAWSLTFDPTRRDADAYAATFDLDRAEFRRSGKRVNTNLQVAVSPEHPVEVRRITLTNHSRTPSKLALTTYAEVVLTASRNDAAHPAFSNLFVETEFVVERSVLLARRRPRSHTEPETWMFQLLLPESGDWSGPEFDSSRLNFIGRGRTLADPAALQPGRNLGKTQGFVLDPALSLRRGVTLGAGETAQATLVTGSASSRAQALELALIMAASSAIDRSFELAWADARAELRHLDITGAQAHTFQRLLGSVLFPHPALRTAEANPEARADNRNVLWAEGISGDLPILLLRIDDPTFAELARDVLLAQNFFRLNGVAIDLIILNDEPEGYLMPQQEQLLSLMRACHAEPYTNKPGGVFLRRSALLSRQAQDLLLRLSRVILESSNGSLARQVLRAEVALRGKAAQREAENSGLHPKMTAVPELTMDNGIGGFGAHGQEYVIRVGAPTAAPAPWCNVMANPNFGAVVSERGAGFTWFQNSQQYRLTPWSNDPVCDPPGELVYLRDETNGAFWSATPAGAAKGAEYLVKHGQGYSTFEHVRGGLQCTLTVFVSTEDAVKFYRLRVSNLEPKRKVLSVYAVVEWVLGANRATSSSSIASHCDTDGSTSILFAAQDGGGFPASTFLTSTAPVVSFTSDREEFFGRMGSRENPNGLWQSQLSKRMSAVVDPCGALQVSMTLEPNESGEVTFLLGIAADRTESADQIRRLATEPAIEAAWVAVRAFWQNLLSNVTIATPDPALDALMNHWLLYQAISCRIWARSGFYQSGGAYGFRDQLQDVLATLHTKPSLAREHILRAAARQFESGDVQHWWHANTGQGVRTRCSDDLAWLPFAVEHYVRVTGDATILDERISFLLERELNAGEEDLFSTPKHTSEQATLYEHCIRACHRAFDIGAHSLPKIGSCDWNDGMNRVGAEGRGESIWLAWFLCKTFTDFGALAKTRGDHATANFCRTQSQLLSEAVDTAGWDGAWYRRAYFDDGSALGSASSPECQIDALAQSWAVISQAADPVRASSALYTSLNELMAPSERLMRLLSPPFTGQGANPGYIAAYPPGVRENGGQYTHGALWTLQALCLLGDATSANQLLCVLNPAYQAVTRAGAERYKLEPYVVAADVYGVQPHTGRGGWSWYTGSASWMYRIVLEDFLGIVREGNTLRFKPCVPDSFAEFKVNYRCPGGELHMTFTRVTAPGVSIFENGSSIEGPLQLPTDGRQHTIMIEFGPPKSSGTPFSPS